MRRLIDLMIVLCLPAMVLAQGSRFDANVVTSANNVPYGSQATLYTVPFAFIKVCAYPTAGNPCTNVVNVYSDPALTQAITQPFQADVHGHFGFWISSGAYAYNAQSTGGTNYGNFPFTVAGTGGGSATFPSTPGLVYSLSTSTARNGTAADVTSLFSGCSGSLFLKADGTCGSSGLTLTTTGVNGVSTLTGSTLNVPNYTVTVPILTSLGTLTNDTTGSATKWGGVTVSGVPGIGQVPMALSSTTASWQTPVGIPGGSDKQVQFNNSGSFGGDPNFTWDTASQVFAVGGPKLVPLSGQFIHGPINSGPQEATLDSSLQQWINLADSNVLTAASTDISAGLSVYSQNHFNSIQTASAIYAANHTTGTSSANGIHGVALADPGPGVTNSEFVAGLLGSAQLGSFTTTGTDTGTTPVIAAVYGAASVNFSSGTPAPVVAGFYSEQQQLSANAALTAAFYARDQGTGANHYGIYIAGGNNNLGPNITTVAQLKATDIDIFAPATGLTSSTAYGLHTLGTAISSLNQSAPSHTFYGSYWTGSAAASDSWSIAPVLGSGTNPSSSLTIAHTGTTGVAAVSLPMTAAGMTYQAAGPNVLPACASTLNGNEAVVTDATAPTYMGAYISGGAITAKVLCSFNGTTYSWVTH